VLASFYSLADKLLAAHPDVKEEIGLVHTAMITIGQLVQASTHVNDNSAVWMQLADRAEDERRVLCKQFEGKALFSGIQRLYALKHREMRDSLLDTTKWEPAQDNEEFRYQKRRKRIPSQEMSQNLLKTATATPATSDTMILPLGERPTRNIFASLRANDMEVERPVVEDPTQQPDGEPQQESSGKSGRPPHCANIYN
jgi:hypothetical protein